jgi:hypothetical protein
VFHRETPPQHRLLSCTVLLLFRQHPLLPQPLQHLRQFLQSDQVPALLQCLHLLARPSKLVLQRSSHLPALSRRFFLCDVNPHPDQRFRYPFDVQGDAALGEVGAGFVLVRRAAGRLHLNAKVTEGRRESFQSPGEEVCKEYAQIGGAVRVDEVERIEWRGCKEREKGTDEGAGQLERSKIWEDGLGWRSGREGILCRGESKVLEVRGDGIEEGQGVLSECVGGDGEVL